jgi:hypothetical protein
MQHSPHAASHTRNDACTHHMEMCKGVNITKRLWKPVSRCSTAEAMEARACKAVAV